MRLLIHFNLPPHLNQKSEWVSKLLLMLGLLVHKEKSMNYSFTPSKTTSKKEKKYNLMLCNLLSLEGIDDFKVEKVHRKIEEAFLLSTIYKSLRFIEQNAR